MRPMKGNLPAFLALASAEKVCCKTPTKSLMFSSVSMCLSCVFQKKKSRGALFSFSYKKARKVFSFFPFQEKQQGKMLRKARVVRNSRIFNSRWQTSQVVPHLIVSTRQEPRYYCINKQGSYHDIDDRSSHHVSFILSES